MPKPFKLNLICLLNDRENGKKGVYRHLERAAEKKATLPNLNQACECSLKTKSTFLLVSSHDKSRLASAHGDHTVRVTDVMCGKTTHILNGLKRTPWTIAFHPSNSDVLAAGCIGGIVHIWDLRQFGTVYDEWHTPEYTVTSSITFHPFDNILVIATGNFIYFWDYSCTKPDALYSISTPKKTLKVRWIKFDPLGYYLYTGISNQISNEQSVQRARPFGILEQRSDLSNDERQVVRMRNLPTLPNLLTDMPLHWRFNYINNSGSVNLLHGPNSSDEEEDSDQSFHPMLTFNNLNAQRVSRLHNFTRAYNSTQNPFENCRIDRWKTDEKPDLENISKKKPIFSGCKLHFDASLTMSHDGEKLALLVPGRNDQQSICIISLKENTLGDVLICQSISSTVVSLSFSPLNTYIAVGLSSKRVQLLFPPKQLIAQIYKTEGFQHVCDISHPSQSNPRFLVNVVSVNAVCWLPGAGDGIVYGTNHGHLHICRPGLDDRHPSEASSMNVGNAQLVRVRLSRETQTD